MLNNIVYLVYSFSEDCCDVIAAYITLERANETARRNMYDSWRVQDGIIPKEIIRSDGTICYSILDGLIGYYVETQKIEE